MTRFFLIFALIFTGSAFSQTDEKAVPTYSINDKLIGLANLYGGLSDCSIRSVAGKVKDVDQNGDKVEIILKVDKKTSEKVIVPLGRVADADRRAVFRHLITKNNVLRAAGYSCNSDEPFLAFSIDRVY